MENHLIVEDWGLIVYAEAWQRQEELFNQRLVSKARQDADALDHIILCEHPHVYTLGRSGKAANMLMTDEQLKRIGASYYHIDRGGDITYHGPGQLVCYPILDLERYHLGLKEYIWLIEESVMRVCASYGIET